MKYFKLTSETKTNIFGIKLFQLEFKIDCQWGKVGDKAGWIESETTPSGDARVSGNALVLGDAQVYGNARVSGDARVSGNALVYGDAQVYGNALVYGDAWEKSPLQIQGTKHFVNICAKGKLKIGCKEFEIAFWAKNFKKIGREQGYTEQEIKEYSLYIKLAQQLDKE